MQFSVSSQRSNHQMNRWRAPLAAAVLALSVSACKKSEPPPVPEPAAVTVKEPAPPAKPPLKVAYSDWPGWTAFEVGIQKGWFKDAGLNIEFSWFDYLASMDAFAAGKVDAVMVTNGDALVTGGSGAKSKMILVTDYSNGNDKIVAKRGIKTLKDLKGKKVGLELRLVEHLMLLKGLEKAGLKPDSVKLVNFATNETPQALSSGQVDAVGAWYPIAGQSLTAVPGSTAVFTSADVPGLIYDAVTVNPQSLEQRKSDWETFVKVWYKISAYVRDPATQADAVKIMAAKVGVSPAEYAAALPGTYFLSVAEAKKRFEQGEGLDSLYGSSKVADDFNVANKVYAQPQMINDYIYPDFVLALPAE